MHATFCRRKGDAGEGAEAPRAAQAAAGEAPSAPEQSAPAPRHLDLFSDVGLDYGTTAGHRSGRADTTPRQSGGHPEFEKEAKRLARRALERERLADVPFGGRPPPNAPLHKPWEAQAAREQRQGKVAWGTKAAQRMASRLAREREAEDPLTGIRSGLKSAALLKRMGRAGHTTTARARSRSPPPAARRQKTAEPQHGAAGSKQQALWAMLRQQRRQREAASRADDEARLYS